VQTYTNVYTHYTNTSIKNHTPSILPKAKICQHASRINKNCSNALRVCQINDLDDKDSCLESSFNLASDRKHYQRFDWKLFFSLHYRAWIIENCKNGARAISQHKNATTCPYDLPEHTVWKFEGNWNKSLPNENTKFKIEDDSLYDWKSKLIRLTHTENKPFIVEENVNLETINTLSIIPLEENEIKNYDTPLERLLKRIENYKQIQIMLMNMEDTTIM
jgi:hypothetical protein